MPTLTKRVPAYRLHKASDQAMVTLNCVDHYLGPFGSEESRAKYDRLLSEWLSAGRYLAPVSPAGTTPSIAVNDLILRFWEHIASYYRRPDGTPTSEPAHFRGVLKLTRRLYGSTAAIEFGPSRLRAVRQAMIDRGWSRRHINHQVRRLTMMFKFAGAQELLPASVYEQLRLVEGLKRGRSTAREMPRKLPADPRLIDVVRPFVSRQVWTMIQLQLLCGCRPGEIVILRGSELDRRGTTWKYRPEQHKTAHHGRSKTIYLGPRAQQLLQPFLEGRDPEAFVFSASDADVEHRARKHAARQTPMSCGNRPGTNVKRRRTRPIRACYNEESYARAITRACRLAFPPPPELASKRIPGKKGTRNETDAEWRTRLGAEQWNEVVAWRRSHHWHPHQLRHNAATNIRAEFGIEAARLILGNSSIPMAELYAEANEQKAVEIIQSRG